MSPKGAAADDGTAPEPADAGENFALRPKAELRKAEKAHLVEVKKRKREMEAELQQNKKMFERGDKTWMKKSKNKFAKNVFGKEEFKARDATDALARAEMLNTENAGYLEAGKTWKVNQRQIRQAVDVQTAAKQWSFSDDQHLGPYMCDYAANGRTLAFASAKGHVATINTQTHKLVGELQLKETIRDLTFCHDDRWIVVAQKKHAYMYTHEWVEAHKMDHHEWPNKVEFLRHHFLITSVGRLGNIVWQDISTGKLVSKRKTKWGECFQMTQNPWNACLATGHTRGHVMMWSPKVETYLTQMMCHLAPITGIAIDLMGRNMVTTAADSSMKVWDLRMFKELHTYKTSGPAVDVKISQTMMVALGYQYQVEFWKGLFGPVKKHKPYMTHYSQGRVVKNISYCPYEDIVGIGVSNGFQSIIVPGVGEANIDSFLPNPMETAKQRAERPVKQLLDKLPPETIMLDPDQVGVMRKKGNPGEKLKDLVTRQKEFDAKAGVADADVGSDEDEDSQKDSDEEVGTVDQETVHKKKKGKPKPEKTHKKKQINRAWGVVQNVKRANAERKDQAIKERKASAKKQGGGGGAAAEEPVRPASAMDVFFDAKRKEKAMAKKIPR